MDGRWILAAGFVVYALGALAQRAAAGDIGLIVMAVGLVTWIVQASRRRRP